MSKETAPKRRKVSASESVAADEATKLSVESVTQFLLKSDDRTAFEMVAGLNTQDRATLLEKFAAIERVILSQRLLKESKDIQQHAVGISPQFLSRMMNNFSLLSHEDNLKKKLWYTRRQPEPDPYYGKRQLTASFIARSTAGEDIEIFLESSFDFELEDYAEDASEGSMTVTMGASEKSDFFTFEANLEQDDDQVHPIDVQRSFDTKRIASLIKKLGYGNANPEAFVRLLAACMDTLLTPAVKQPRHITPSGSIASVFSFESESGSESE
eukprot:TRINITY_DN15790_c0_g1_i1.p1 TRINITY_DN15790_c0_g1~~TRINITY_DN15790_c0_g1_i1.p1  ORF type:complete len:270 (-),score=52.47 TRINITY_DN15790_c0_g1_i1:20-829(-)